MRERWRPQQVLTPAPGARLADWRARLADASPEDQAALAEEHAGLLLALLRRAGSACPSPRERPLDAREACRRLGQAPVRLLLETHLLLIPAQTFPARTELRALALREAGAALLARQDDAGPAEEPWGGQAARTLLRLLEWVPRSLDTHDAAGAAGSMGPASSWGERLLALAGGEHWYHPALIEGLRALAGREGDVHARRLGALLRAAIEESGSARPGPEWSGDWPPQAAGPAGRGGLHG